ncbi:hypothetical protein FF011L_02860 [Roseimaritima multifibrata]|uniref:Sulfatase n=1 Tax=Roseimaritima multifibrata TaxID=1930274 RepID=A0A517M9J0_9BACT|nr:DUF1501 domain-containing protein [Roseimaritima multifibrata]QDS91556.1 hypothetical protein FF011L_02860 [Roseimaritima multifibrata]
MNLPLHTNRREFLHRASGGFGALALAGMWSEIQAAATDPLATKPGHFPAKADRVIFIFSTGGVSHVDTFDHKPQLIADHGKSVTASRWLNKSGEFERFLIKPRWGFKQYGESGTWVSDLFPHMGSVIDDVCVLNAMHCESDGHDKATLAAHTGSAQFARPSAGAWVSYGLGTENQNLPSFMVLAPSAPYAGAQTWGSDFLPACHQGTHVMPGKQPLPNIQAKVPADLQQMELAMLNQLNRAHLEQRDADQALDARIRSFETAFGMQREAPEAFDLSGESESTLNMYGLQRGANSGFGWQCLVARRLAERGVRFLELIDVGSNSNWDSHGNMGDHQRLAKAIDQPIAGLLADLKQRGMLERTLVVWTTEFGRTPFHKQANHAGREHHNHCFSSWMAGGGVKAGLVHGKSDEHGIMTAEGAVHTHDLHATMLHLLGIDHERLTYRYAGRDFRLTDVHGKVPQEILA